MKKYLNIALLLLSIFSLTSCFGKDTSDNVEDVKKDLLNPSSSGNVVDENVPKYEDNITSTGTNIDTTNTQNIVNTEKYSVKYLGDKNFIEIDNLDKEDFANRKVEIT
jgi:predicted small secreted protein